MESVLAAVRVAPGKTEIREFPMPDIPPDSALLKMEVAGICGTDRQGCHTAVNGLSSALHLRPSTALDQFWICTTAYPFR